MHMLLWRLTVMATLETAYGYGILSLSMPMFATKRFTDDNPSIRATILTWNGSTLRWRAIL
jgi:hypothetical protein